MANLDYELRVLGNNVQNKASDVWDELKKLHSKNPMIPALDFLKYSADAMHRSQNPVAIPPAVPPVYGQPPASTPATLPSAPQVSTQGMGPTATASAVNNYPNPGQPSLMGQRVAMAPQDYAPPSAEPFTGPYPAVPGDQMQYPATISMRSAQGDITSTNRAGVTATTPANYQTVPITPGQIPNTAAGQFFQRDISNMAATGAPGITGYIDPTTRKSVVASDPFHRLGSGDHAAGFSAPSVDPAAYAALMNRVSGGGVLRRTTEEAATLQRWASESGTAQHKQGIQDRIKEYDQAMKMQQAQQETSESLATIHAAGQVGAAQAMGDAKRAAKESDNDTKLEVAKIKEEQAQTVEETKARHAAELEAAKAGHSKERVLQHGENAAKLARYTAMVKSLPYESDPVKRKAAYDAAYESVYGVAQTPEETPSEAEAPTKSSIDPEKLNKKTRGW